MFCFVWWGISLQTVDEAKNLRGIEDFNFNFQRIGVLYALDYDKDGKFKLSDLHKFAEFCSQVMPHPNMTFVQEIEAQCTLLMWRQASSGDTGRSFFIDWFTRLFSAGMKMRIKGYQEIFVNTDIIATMYELLQIRESYEISPQTLITLLQSMGEELRLIRTGDLNELLDNVVPLECVRQFGGHFVDGFLKIMKELGFTKDLLSINTTTSDTNTTSAATSTFDGGTADSLDTFGLMRQGIGGNPLRLLGEDDSYSLMSSMDEEEEEEEEEEDLDEGNNDDNDEDYGEVLTDDGSNKLGNQHRRDSNVDVDSSSMNTPKKKSAAAKNDHRRKSITEKPGGHTKTLSVSSSFKNLHMNLNNYASTATMTTSDAERLPPSVAATSVNLKRRKLSSKIDNSITGKEADLTKTSTLGQQQQATKMLPERNSGIGKNLSSNQQQQQATGSISTPLPKTGGISGMGPLKLDLSSFK